MVHSPEMWTQRTHSFAGEMCFYATNTKQPCGTILDKNYVGHQCVKNHGELFLFISITFPTYPSMSLKSFYLMTESYMKYNPSVLG